VGLPMERIEFLMQLFLEVAWSAMALVSMAVTAVAVGLWTRDVLREQDTDGVEPSPVSARSVPYILLAGCVFIGTRLFRGEPLSFNEVGFAAMFIGFTCSAGWYLLARRGTEVAVGGSVAKLSAVVAASYGALSALTFA